MVEPGSGSHRPVPGSPIDRGQRQLGAARPGIVHERTRCRSQVQVRIGERGIRQASVGEVRAVEVGFRQVRTRQVRTRQVRTRQVRTREVRIGQVGSGQVRKRRSAFVRLASTSSAFPALADRNDAPFKTACGNAASVRMARSKST